MRKFTIQEIIKAYTSKGYSMNIKVGEVNIFGVRNMTNVSNSFDDCVGIIYREKENEWSIVQYNATTDPGKYFLENPMNIDGTAIIIPQQCIKCYKVGKHTGYEAMEQIAPIKYVRDNNKNSVLDFLYDVTGAKIFSQIGKTNIHHAGVNSSQVDKWSAGCQVLSNLKEFEEFMSIVKKSDTYKTINKFDYTLFELKIIK